MKHLSLVAVLLVGATVTGPQQVIAQGSIFGQLQNADLSTPPDNAIRFIGFINNTDNELRLQSCIGAGVENGHWFDDFQNYQGEAPGIEYHYYFFNVVNSQGAILNKIIPSNSFQQEDVSLLPAVYPAPATGLSAQTDAGVVNLEWQSVPDVTWHIYRRVASSGGSFFRIDSPGGNRSNPGVAEAVFVDADVDEGACYHYLLVTESQTGAYSPASEIIEVDLSSCCQGLVGDVNGIGGDEPTIGDISLLIDHLFISYSVPACLPEADVNQSGGANPSPQNISISDASMLIDHLFINYVPLPHCTDAGSK